MLGIVHYPGGKFYNVPNIYGYFPDHIAYHELFGGTLIVYLNKRPATTGIANDIDPYIVNVWRCLSSPAMAQELRARFANMEVTEIWRNKMKAFLQTTPLPTEPSLEHAYAYLYLLQTGYAGGIDFTNYGRSGASRIRLLTETEVVAYLVRRLVIVNKSVFDVLDQVNHSRHLVFLDPPYVGAEQAYTYGFSEREMEELLNWMRDAKCYVLLAHYPHALIDKYGFERKIFLRQRCMANREKRGRLAEAYYANYSLSDALYEQRKSRWWLFSAENSRFLTNLRKTAMLRFAVGTKHVPVGLSQTKEESDGPL
jgi:site-specific DNA-adenine methylase